MTVKKTDNKQKDGRHKLTSAGPGRPKGVQNKFTDLKKAFFGVFEKIENEAIKKKTIDSFYAWATKNSKNQGEFYKMLSKMLPTNVTLEGDLPITYIISEKFKPQKRKDDARK